MNVIKKLEQYNENYVYFCDSIKNNVMSEGNFIRIIYSTPIFSLNGVYLVFTLNNIAIEKYYNKYKCIFDVTNHIDLLEQINKIENNLLKKISIPNKMPQYKIYDQLKNGNIKIFSDYSVKTSTNFDFLLKISGIWETDTQYGITYKFSKITHI